MRKSKQSKSNELKVAPAPEVVAEPETPVNAPVMPTAPAVEKLAETDRLSLELAKSKKDAADAEVVRAQLKAENADLTYRYHVLQLYMKYGLTARDGINEQGSILRDVVTEDQQ